MVNKTKGARFFGALLGMAFAVACGASQTAFGAQKTEPGADGANAWGWAFNPMPEWGCRILGAVLILGCAAAALHAKNLRRQARTLENDLLAAASGLIALGCAGLAVWMI